MERILATKTPQLIGDKVTLKGWVDTKRDHGRLVFIDLRDRSGIVQIVGDKEFKRLKPEYVIEVTGKVRRRSEDTINVDIDTGEVEVFVDEFTVLNQSETLPFPIDTEGNDIGEELRLKHRYLDLRRPRLQKNIKLRSQYIQAAREYLFDQDFTEIETPLLTKSTPEGSRDFIVPSRLQPGKFFALPQSPQQYKQLLMTAGFERYFQIARAIRDEDPRSDRGFEHTQIDVEVSFVEREDVMRIMEDMTIHAAESIEAKIAQKPFPIFTHKEAMEQFGADKFDLRTPDEKDQGLLSFAWVVDFPFFEQTPEGKWTFTHNPFSQPKEEHLDWHLKGEKLDQILTTQYDLVCNGYEVAGGSIRAHRPEVLRATYHNMGYSEVEINENVGHMLEAFSYGTPPHGGCAQGVERLLMTILGEEFIREVQAFPQTGKGSTSVMDAPSPISPAQLAEAGISLRQKTFDSVYEALKNELDTRGIKYQEYEHDPVETSEEAAQARGDTSLSQGAKAMVIRVKDDHWLYVLPADRKVDFKHLRSYFDTSRVKLAPLGDIKNIAGVEPGGIPPFGSLMGLKTLIHPDLSDQEEIAFNAGRQDRSIKMNYKDFEAIELPHMLPQQ